jgi:hypothetical protein
MAATRAGSRKSRRRVARSLILLPILMLAVVIAGAATYVSYVLWPRWPKTPVVANAPALPIVVGNVTFNVPPAAIRVAMQRRPGAQERIDLAFLWPSLAPPGEEKPGHPDLEAEAKPIDRIFVTIAAANESMPPVERLRTIYPRYVIKDPSPAPAGLVSLAFREGAPYQGEDLIYEFDKPERFFVRCTRSGPGRLPGTCLAEQRIGEAHVTLRLPREWLGDWRSVASGIDRLIASLQPKK